MQPVDTLIHARYIIPVEPEGHVFENHCLGIQSGQIVDIIPQTEAKRCFEAVNILHLNDHVLIPGLINAHTHAAMTLMRGLADDLPLMKWLQEHIWPAESAWVSSEFVQDGTQLAIAEMLRGGTTCFNDMYFFPDVAADVVKSAGMRAVLGLIVLDFPTVWANNAQEYLSKGIEVFDRYRDEPLIHHAFAPHAPYSVANEPLEKIKLQAEELDIPVHMHVHESIDEVEQSINDHGMRPLARLDKIGLLSPRLLAVHMTQLNDDEVKLLSTSGSHVIHCPESNLKLASGTCSVAALLDTGVNVAIGTDGAASNNDLDMLGEMRTAALLAKNVTGDASSVPAERALSMATINGARALGLDETIGSLLPGKSADITAINLGDIETQPVYHPVSQLVYATGRDKVTDVWVAGQHLLKDRKLTTIDEKEVITRARKWGEKIRETESPESNMA